MQSEKMQNVSCSHVEEWKILGQGCLLVMEMQIVDDNVRVITVGPSINHRKH